MTLAMYLPEGSNKGFPFFGHKMPQLMEDFCIMRSSQTISGGETQNLLGPSPRQATMFNAVRA